jgi:hypothetical protein
MAAAVNPPAQRATGSTLPENEKSRLAAACPPVIGSRLKNL